MCLRILGKEITMNVTIEKMKSLIIELDYQSEFSYEQRVDFFNKWGVSTATKYFNPIMSLAELIEKLYINNSIDFNEWDLQNYGLSHSGAVMSAFNNQIKENTSKLLKIHIDSTNLLVLHFHKYISSEKEFKLKILFRVKDNIFAFKLFDVDMWFPHKKDYSEVIEDFINDFSKK